jgi:protease IV
MTKIKNYLSLKNIFFFVLILQFAPFFLRSLKTHVGQLLGIHKQMACLLVKNTIGSSSYWTKHLKLYFKDKAIKAILLKIDSPGGAAGSCEAIAHELLVLKGKYPKPIISLSENCCASGAYYIAAATDYIISAPSTLIGSIGVTIPYQFRFHDFLSQHHIGYETIDAGKYKSVGDPFARHSSDHTKLLESVVKDSYDNFMKHVSDHRPLAKMNKVDLWAEGKIFTGQQAQALGLIDQIGGWSDAVAQLKARVGMAEDDKIDWVIPHATSSWLAMFKQEEFEDPESPQEKLSVSLLCKKALVALCELCGGSAESSFTQGLAYLLV